MMKVIVRFYESCIRIILDSSKHEKKISMGYIEQTLGEPNGVMHQITHMKLISPTTPEHEVRKKFDDILEMIDAKFRDMQFA
jgi:hypothetical protein